MKFTFRISLLICLLLQFINCQSLHKDNDIHVHLANDCEANDIFKSIPFHYVGPLVTSFLRMAPERRSLYKLISSPYFTSLVGGLTNAIENQHLFGFVAGVGEHVADFLDHFVGVTKSINKPNDSDQVGDSFLAKISGKTPSTADRHNMEFVPLELAGTFIRGLVRYLPSEKSKHCYYNRYEPVVKKMKAHVNSAEFKNFLGKVQQSYKPMQYNQPKVQKRNMDIETGATANKSNKIEATTTTVNTTKKKRKFLNLI